MKYLFVLGSFYPAQEGGPSNTIYDLAKGLVSRGHEVSVVAFTWGLTPELIACHNLAINQPNQLKGDVTAFYYESPGKLFYWLSTNLRRHDVLCLTSVFFPLTWLAAAMANLYRVPFNLAPRGELMPNALMLGRMKKSLCWHLFLRRLYLSARYVIVTSPEEFSASRSYFKNTQIRILPNFIDMGRARIYSNETLNAKRDILYLGRLHPIKALENLITAYTLLPSEVTKRHRLILAGSGSPAYVHRLKDLAHCNKLRDNIVFVGHLEGEDKIHAYKLAKIFVLPSHSENFGNVVLEALSHCTPVVASKNTPWSALPREQCGLWTDNDPRSLAGSILQLALLDQETYQQAAVAAFEYVDKNFSIQNAASQIEAALAL